MNYSANTFTLELCNIWDNTTPEIPMVFSMYFLFKSSEDTSYFSMPSLCMKIANRGSVDKSDVRLYVDYLETMGLFNTFASYLNNGKQNQNVSFSNGRYYLGIETIENGDKCVIKLANKYKQVGMNFPVPISTMYQLTQTLKSTIQELQKTSIMFVQIIQNQRLLQTMNEIKGMVAGFNGYLNSHDMPVSPDTVFNPQMNVQPTTSDPIPQMNVQPTTSDPIPQMNVPPTTELPINSNSNKTITETISTASSLQNQFEKKINQTLETTNYKQIVSILKNIIKDKGGHFDYGLYDNIFNSLQIYIPNLPSFSELHKHISMTGLGFEHYMKTLVYLANQNGIEKTKQPLYCLKFKDINILKDMKLLAEALSYLFFNAENVSELLFCRTMFAPFWITYYGININDVIKENYVGEKSKNVFAIIEKFVPLFTSSPFWENKYIPEIINGFIKMNYGDQKPFNCINFSNGVISQFFSLYFYSGNICKNLNDFNDLRVEITNLISDLENFKTYTKIKKNYNFKKMSSNFLKAVSIFDAEHVDKELTLEQIENLYKEKASDESFDPDGFIQTLDAIITM